MCRAQGWLVFPAKPRPPWLWLTWGAHRQATREELGTHVDGPRRQAHCLHCPRWSLDVSNATGLPLVEGTDRKPAARQMGGGGEGSDGEVTARRGKILLTRAWVVAPLGLRPENELQRTQRGFQQRWQHHVQLGRCVCILHRFPFCASAPPWDARGTEPPSRLC